MAGDERSLESRGAALAPDVRERIPVTSGSRAVLAEDTETPSTDAWGFSNVPKLLDFFKGTDHLRSDHVEEEQGAAYQSLTPGCIVWGHVCGGDAKSLTVDIKALVAYDLDGVPPTRWRFSVGPRVLGQCSVDPTRREFAHWAASPVVALVREVRPSGQAFQVVLSMRETDIPSYTRLFPPRDLTQCGPWLGKGPNAPPRAPRPDVLRDAGASASIHSIPYMDWLELDNDFHSLHCAPGMRMTYGVKEGWSVYRGWAHRGDKAETSEVDRLLHDGVKPATRTAWAIDSTKRGRFYYEKHDYDTAIKLCEQAMELDATHVPTYTLRGAAFAKKRKYGEACRDFRVAVKLDPSNEHARKYLHRIEKEHPTAAGKVSMLSGPGRVDVCKTSSFDVKRESPDEMKAQLEREIAEEVAEREKKRARSEKDRGRKKGYR